MSGNVGLLLIAAPAAPLAVAMLAPLGLGRGAWPLLALSALPAFAAAVLAPGAEATLPGLLFGAPLALDPLFAPALLAAALIWGLAALHAAGGMRDDPAAPRFATLFGLAMSGNMALLVAGDLIVFYVGFSVMSVAAYGLVAHRGDGQADRAAGVYMGFAVFGELALFAAILLTDAASGAAISPRASGEAAPAAALWLALLGFGIKMGLVPLHLWLPLAHPAAPPAASAALSGAMLKAGLVGLIGFLGPGLPAPEAIGQALLWLGLLGAVAAALYGAAQEDAKTALAYSSVSQLGLAAALLGATAVGLADPVAAGAALMVFALHHGLAKGALFLLCDSGLTRRATLLLAAAAALSLIGAPLTAGALVKARFEAALLPEAPAAAFAAVAFATALAMGRALVLLARKAPRRDPSKAAGALALTAAALAAPFLVPGGLQTLAGKLEPAAALLALAPVAVAAAILALAAVLRPPVPAAPPGDLLAVFEAAVADGRRLLASARRRAGEAASLAPAAQDEPDPRWTLAGAAVAGVAAAAAWAAM